MGSVALRCALVPGAGSVGDRRVSYVVGDGAGQGIAKGNAFSLLSRVEPGRQVLLVLFVVILCQDVHKMATQIPVAFPVFPVAPGASTWSPWPAAAVAMLES